MMSKVISFTVRDFIIWFLICYFSVTPLIYVIQCIKGKKLIKAKLRYIIFNLFLAPLILIKHIWEEL